MSHKRSRTYHDPLHGAISLNRHDPVEALLIDLIDTSPFQRLRRIQQLGAASLTFHGAESSRFTHALGVMELTRRAFDFLAQRYPHLLPHRATVLCAALLHDIGHGPFSHTAEEIFKIHHEHWTKRIIHESSAISTLLTRYDPGLLTAIESVYTHRHPVPVVWQLVSSQLDCDRLDYLMRDSYFTGASYGHLDLDRILCSLEVDSDSNLMVSRKGQAAVEHYLLVRYFMYAQVYNHPKNLAATWILHQAFEHARTHVTATLDADDTMQAWLQHPDQALALGHYLEADDAVFLYHLKRWQHHFDPLLRDLCQRFINRNLFKTWDVSELSEGDRTNLLDRMRTEAAIRSYPPEIYCTIRHSQTRGYTLYQHGIKVNMDGQPVDIERLSSVVEPLTHTHHRAWLIYPQEMAPWLKHTLASATLTNAGVH